MIAPGRVGEQRLVEGGRAGQHGHALRLNALHDPPGVEDRLGDHRRPRHQAGQDAGLVAEGVEERVHHEVAVARAEAHDGGPGAEGAQRLRVRRRRALGVARRAGGEDEVRHVAGLHGHGPRRRLFRLDAGARVEELGQAAHRDGRRRGPRFLVAQQDDPLQRAHVLAHEEGGVVDPQEAAHGQKHRRARRTQDVPRLAALEARVEGDEHGAGAQRAERGEHPLGAVRRPQRDPVPRPHAGGDQPAGVAVHLGCQLVVGQADRAVDQRLGAGVARGGVLDQPRDRSPRQIGAGVLRLRRCAADAAHGCWLLTETTSPLRYDE